MTAHPAPAAGVPESLIVAVDSSTTACKVLVFDREGRIVAEARSEHTLDNPAPDAYEQDANQWWSALTAALTTTMGRLSRSERGHLAGLVVTHQRETVVVTDEQGAPLHPALVWMDARAHRQVASSVEHFGAERLHRLSGKPACVTPSLYKLLYLFEAKGPELRAKAPLVFDVHGWLVFRLTGERVTSLPSADPLGLVDMEARDWSEPLLELLGLTRHAVPRLVEAGTRVGGVSESAARATGLPVGLPVIAGAGDGQCAGLGAGITRPGSAYLNLGTAVVSGIVSHHYVVDRAFRTLFAAVPGAYYLETDLKGGTFTLDWLAQDLLGNSTGDKTALLKTLEREAESMEPGSDGLLLLPYFAGVMNPYWDDAASGMAFGLRGGHRAAHLYRAILEGIAFEQRLHTRGVEAATGLGIPEFVVMGGGSQSNLFCQIVADVTEKPVVRAATSEATALGAALLASVALGLHPSFEAAERAMTKRGTGFAPTAAAAHYERLFNEVYAPLYPAVQKLMARLAELRRSPGSPGVTTSPSAHSISKRIE